MAATNAAKSKQAAAREHTQTQQAQPASVPVTAHGYQGETGIIGSGMIGQEVVNFQLNRWDCMDLVGSLHISAGDAYRRGDFTSMARLSALNTRFNGYLGLGGLAQPQWNAGGNVSITGDRDLGESPPTQARVANAGATA